MSQIRPENTDRAFPHLDEWGLSKREYFAAMALQGFAHYDSQSQNDESRKTIAKKALRLADALIAALKEEKK